MRLQDQHCCDSHQCQCGVMAVVSRGDIFCFFTENNHLYYGLPLNAIVFHIDLQTCVHENSGRGNSHTKAVIARFH